VKQAAAKLGITVQFIPLDLTDEYRLLYRAAFGVLKAQANHLFYACFF
jgi:hypothetical protein